MTKIVAELCQNHLGDFSIVEEMVSSAASAGASIIKIQTIFADDLSFRPQFEDGCVLRGVTKCIKRPYQSEYDRLKKLELSLEQISKFIELVRSYNLIPMTTCFTRQHIDKMFDAGFDHIKIASYDCASFQFLREAASKFKFLLVSTGATFDDEIQKAAEILKATSYALLHCVTLYPTPLSEFNLSRMNYLTKFTNNVGLSDHSNFQRDGIIASAAAIYLGASYIERHFTILPSDNTKDGPVSITRDGLSSLSAFSEMSKSDQKSMLSNLCPEWESLLMGSSQRCLSSEELLNRDYYRGRFASNFLDNLGNQRSVYNWEETLIQ